jgi:environmental stress-induced protein Ves
MQILRKASFTATPWKNGGGITHEVIRVPAGDGVFRWRVSVAQIDVSGPFSDFTGYRRTMVLLRGRGVRLTFDGAPPTSLTDVGDLAEFDGALKTDCCLVDGPCTDLNLMVAKSVGRVGASVERLREPRVLPALRNGVSLVFGISGGLAVECAAGRAQLEPWDLAILPSGGPDGPDGTAVVTADASSLVFLATLDDNST